MTLLFSVAVIFFCYKQLLFITFDRDVARIYGVQVEWVDTLLSFVLAATIIVSMQTLGVTLIAAAILSLAEWWTYHRRWTVCCPQNTALYAA